MECSSSGVRETTYTDDNCRGTVVTMEDYGGCEADGPRSTGSVCVGSMPSMRAYESPGCTGNSYTGAYPFGTACTSLVLFLQPVPLTFACGDSFESN